MWVGSYIKDVGASISSGSLEGLGVNASCKLVLAKIEGAASRFLQQIHEVSASHGASSKLDMCLQIEGVGASCEWVLTKHIDVIE